MKIISYESYVTAHYVVAEPATIMKACPSTTPSSYQSLYQISYDSNDNKNNDVGIALQAIATAIIANNDEASSAVSNVISCALMMGTVSYNESNANTMTAAIAN